MKPLVQVQYQKTEDGRWQWLLLSRSGKLLAVSIPYGKKQTAIRRAVGLFGSIM